MSKRFELYPQRRANKINGKFTVSHAKVSKKTLATNRAKMAALINRIQQEQIQPIILPPGVPLGAYGLGLRDESE